MWADGHGYCFSCETYFPSDIKKDFLVDDNTYTYEYLPYRGISKSTYAFYDVKTKINKDGKPISLGYRHPNGDYKVRNFDTKEFFWHNAKEPAKAGLFGMDKFSPGSHKSVTITEGYEDALSIYETLRSPAVSVHSAVTAARDCAMARSWLNSFERIYLAFDADERGRDAARAVAKLFDFNKIYDVKFSGGNRKDANDYLKAGERDELATVWNNAKRYLPETVISSFSEFDKILNEHPKDGVPYPFPTLNYMTYGIRTGESVLVTAQEGVGKTEFMHAIEYQLLKETKDAIGAIFLEEPKRRHLQAIAGLELKRPAHLPDSGITNATISGAVQKVVGTDDRLHLYSHFGSDDPDVILDTIRFLVTARSCRFILLDHITMVVSGSSGENERRALDYLSTRLEMMVKELDFALIVVSHVNDDGLTRGSRNISKIADIRIDLKRDLITSDPVIRRTTHLTVSKNRFCGRTGPAGELLFDPTTYSLEEFLDYETNLKEGFGTLVA